MKSVVETTLKINVLALNAMFMIKTHDHKNGGFSKIASLFRTFSSRLNVQMEKNKKLSYGMLTKAAKYKVYSRYDGLVNKALKDPRAHYINKSFTTGRDTRQMLEMLLRDKADFQRGIDNSIRLIGEAEIMLVLTKIEVQYADINTKVADNLTRGLDETISNIILNVNECAAAMVA